MEKRRAAIIGGGVIGGGWAARFALNGWDVHIYDPDKNARTTIQTVLARARASLPQLADSPLPEEGGIDFCDTVQEAVSQADWIQESVPEQLAIKLSILRDIQAACPQTSIIGSSTSGFKPSQLRTDALCGSQIIVAHPYNPVYLLPVVELVGGEEKQTVKAAAEILNSLGMQPVILRREIDAHIGDRLLEAIWREALWLIKDDIANTAEIDEIITHGFGLRWAQMGLFETYRIAGGEKGMRHFISQFGPALSWPWTKLVDVPELDAALADKIASQSDAQSGQYSIAELETIRDRNLVAFLKILKDHKWAAGQSYGNWRPADGLQPPQTDQWEASVPFCRYYTQVLPAWIDYNGHMTEFRYLQVMSNASDVLLADLGLSTAYLDSGYSIYTVETHIRHLAEAKLGERLSVVNQILSADEKKIRLWHSVVTDGGVEVATGEQMWLHVDMKAGRAAPMQSPLRERMLALYAAHQALPLPQGAGRSVGQRG